MAGIASVIKYEGDNNTLVWKHPCEDFNTTTQLIVHESQQAVFYMNGQALDLFEAGRYTLHTQNIPLINKFFNRAYNDVSPFHCEVYFINKTEQMEVKWGTDSKIEYIEPTYGFPIQIGANGELTWRVKDAKKLLTKIVGTEKELTRSGLLLKLRAFLMTKLKPCFAAYMRQNTINIFELDEHISTLSEAMKEQLAPAFSDYGISLVHFFVLEVVKPENDANYIKFKDIHFRQYADLAEAKIRQNVGIIDEETKKQRMIIESQGLAAKRRIEGYTYAQERGFDVAEGFSKNEGSGGNLASLGIGLGVMGSVGKTIGAVVDNAVSGAAEEPLITCKNCGASLPPYAKFCMECGAALMQKCLKCNADIPQGSKFCPLCGEKTGGEENHE